MLFRNISIVDRDFILQKNRFVLVENGRFLYIGTEMPDPSEYHLEGHEIIDGNRKLLMPAFYNTHCHVPMTLLRGYGEGLPLNEWLQTKVFPFEAEFDAEEKYCGAMLGALELISSGCVSISDMYSNLVSYGSGLHDAGMKANISNGMIIFDDKSFFDDRSYRDTVEFMEYAEALGDGRMIPCASVHDEFTTTDRCVDECIEFAKENNLHIQIHVSEAKVNHEDCLRRRGITPVRYFEDKGLFDLPVTAAHCVHVTDDDIDILKKHNVFVAHCPSSNLKLGTGIAPLKKMYDKGVPVTIGTDGASSNNNLNMFEEMHLSAMLCRGYSFDSNAIPANEILRIASRNGALSQGREDCGLIDTGMKADFIVLDLDKPHMIPDFDTISNVVFSAQASDILMTVCDGQVLYKDGEFLTIDEEKVKSDAEKTFRKILNKL